MVEYYNVWLKYSYVCNVVAFASLLSDPNSFPVCIPARLLLRGGVGCVKGSGCLLLLETSFHFMGGGLQNVARSSNLDLDSLLEHGEMNDLFQCRF